MATATPGTRKVRKRRRKLIPVGEFGQVIGVSSQTVKRYIREKILAGSQQPDTGRWFVERQSAEAYCKQMDIEFLDHD